MNGVGRGEGYVLRWRESKDSEGDLKEVSLVGLYFYL